MKTNILSILEQVAATSSRNEKEAILQKYADNTTLKRVFKMAYDKQILFWTKVIPSEDVWGTGDHLTTLDAQLDGLEQSICNRVVTGFAADRLIERLFVHAKKEDAEVLKRVILKDLRIGATSGTANKVWKNLIPKPAFMLAETDTKNIVYPAISQLKEDGTRGKFFWDGEKVTITSRNGNEIETHGIFDDWAAVALIQGDTLDGELVAFKNGKRLPRKDSNGIVNKAVKGTITPEEAELLVYVAWDIETMSDIPYKDRFGHLEAIASDTLVIETVETRFVNNYNEAMAHYLEARKRGLEGTILKNINAFWQPKRSYDLVKFKAEYEGEFLVVGFDYGKKGTKNEHRIGALNIESADGLVKGDVGVFRDFPDSIREDWLTDMPKVVTVRYNERIKSRGDKAESLYLPRVVAARWDKDEANTRDELIEIEKNALGDA